MFWASIEALISILKILIMFRETACQMSFSAFFPSHGSCVGVEFGSQARSRVRLPKLSSLIPLAAQMYKAIAGSFRINQATLRH